MRRALLTTAAALAVALPIACGGGSNDDEEQIGDAVERFEAAILAGDTQAFCQAVTPSYVEGLGGLERCAREFKKDLVFTSDKEPVDTTMKDAEIDGDTAVVNLTNGFALNAVKEDGNWYVEPFGPPNAPPSAAPPASAFPEQ